MYSKLLKSFVFSILLSISVGVFADAGLSIPDAINLNTASKEQLMRLPGIGEHKANAIMKYREVNKFKTSSDIQNVPGIGEKTYDNLKPMVTDDAKATKYGQYRKKVKDVKDNVADKATNNKPIEKLKGMKDKVVDSKPVEKLKGVKDKAVDSKPVEKLKGMKDKAVDSKSVKKVRKKAKNVKSKTKSKFKKARSKTGEKAKKMKNRIKDKFKFNR